MKSLLPLLSKLNREECIDLLYYEWQYHLNKVGIYAFRIKELYHQKYKRNATREEITEIFAYIEQQYGHSELFYHAVNLFPLKLGMDTFEVEQALGISKWERMRWTKEGRLPVVDTVQRVRFTNVHTYHIYSRLINEMISQELITKWRQEYEKQKIENFRQGALKGIEKRKLGGRAG